MIHSDPEASNAKIFLKALCQAPSRVQVLVFICLLWGCGSLILLGSEVLDYLGGEDPLRSLRNIGGQLGASGMVLLALAQMLHVSTQKVGEFCTGWKVGLPWERMDQMLLALPVLAFGAGVLMAFGAGCMLIRPTFSAPMLITATMFTGFTLYAGHMVSRTGRFLYRHAQEQAATALQAREEASEAQLTALQAQMNPHFLFNALNTVASLVRTDAHSAEATVENLAQILRRTLERSQRTACSVSDEVDYLRAYLAIEQQRFGERLRVEWLIEPETLELRIPPMSLQPLVENALKHAIGTRLDGGRLQIGAFLLGDKLVLEVQDDGDGFPAVYQEGTGLRNLRERLTTLYGDRAALRFEPEIQGVRVLVELPAIKVREV